MPEENLEEGNGAVVAVSQAGRRGQPDTSVQSPEVLSDNNIANQTIRRSDQTIRQSEDANSHWLHLFGEAPARHQSPEVLSEAKSHWLHLFDFSPLCVFKCVLMMVAFVWRPPTRLQSPEVLSYNNIAKLISVEVLKEFSWSTNRL